MDIIVEKNTNVVRGIGERADDKETYWLINQTRFSKKFFELYEKIDFQENVATMKFCYTPEQGFYENPNWEEPDTSNTFGIPEDVYMAIKEHAIQEVQNELNK